MTHFYICKFQVRVKVEIMVRVRVSSGPKKSRRFLNRISSGGGGGEIVNNPAITILNS